MATSKLWPTASTLGCALSGLRQDVEFGDWGVFGSLRLCGTLHQAKGSKRNSLLEECAKGWGNGSSDLIEKCGCR